MKNIFFVGVFSLIFYNSNSHISNASRIPQELNHKGSDGGKKTIEEKLKKYEGTFQIQLKDVRMKPNIPYNIDEIIEQNRKQTENVYVSIGTYARIKIFSASEIKKNNGKKIDMISSFK